MPRRHARPPHLHAPHGAHGHGHGHAAARASPWAGIRAVRHHACCIRLHHCLLLQRAEQGRQVGGRMGGRILEGDEAGARPPGHAGPWSVSSQHAGRGGRAGHKLHSRAAAAHAASADSCLCPVQAPTSVHLPQGPPPPKKTNKQTTPPTPNPTLHPPHTHLAGPHGHVPIRHRHHAVGHAAAAAAGRIHHACTRRVGGWVLGGGARQAAARGCRPAKQDTSDASCGLRRGALQGAGRPRARRRPTQAVPGGAGR